MTPQIALTLLIVIVAIVLFATEKLRVDVVALLVLITLALTGLVTPVEAFAGFANPAVITVWAVFIVSGGLFKTGVADMLGKQVARLAGNSEARLIAVIMLTCGLMSAFMNNIGATAVLLPAVAGISQQTKIPLSKLLIPLAFSSLLGGNLTLIGTPPNILASSILAERGLPTFSFFDFLPTGIIVFGAGILYMVFIGRHLLPAYEPVIDIQTRRLREYISEVRVTERSPLIGQALYETRLGAEYGLSVLAIIRNNKRRIIPLPDVRLAAGDLLVVEGSAQELVRAQEVLGLVPEAGDEADLVMKGNEMDLVEATLSPRSSMAGRSLKQMRFRDHYGFTALAIWRQGEVILQRLSEVKLQFGDALLLQGPRHRLPGLQEGDDFLVMEPVALEQRRREKAPLAVGIMLLVLALTTLGGMHISLAMVIGVALMILSGVLNMDEAYQSIEWRSVFLIACMLPLGTAMETTGTARFLADLIVGATAGLGLLATLAAIYIMAGLITEPMSNAAATVLMVPIVIDIALELGASPQAFVLATVIGASTSFLTPVGHQANVLVLGPGGYRFADYTRVGAPLNLVILIATLLFLPLFWPLVP
ncbi:MAG TPA: SLC13 family permease [Chloroflexota bacterium]|nr:SLC13 family permease [Chloroflexota bacterium]